MGGYLAYAEYKESGMEWLGEIPSHWDAAKIRFYYNAQLGTMLQPQADSPIDKEIDYLKAFHVQWEGVITDDLPKMWTSPKDKTKYAVRNGDLLICEGGEVGRTALLDNLKSECIIQNALHRVRGTDRASVEFLNYLMRHIAKSGWFDILCSKATIAHLTSEKLRALGFPVPPIAEQRSIARFLDYKTAQIDALITKKETLLKKLAEKRTALISQAVTKGCDRAVPMKDSGIEWLGEIPAHWELVRMRRRWKVIDCKHKTVEFIDEGFPIASIGEVRDHKFNLEQAKRASLDDYLDLIDGRKPEKNDLIYSRNATVGCVGFVDEDIDFCLGQDVCLIKTFTENNRFLWWQLQSISVTDQLQSIFVGATFKRINVADIKAYLVCCPPVDEQQNIAQYLDEKTKVIDQQKVQIEEVIAKLKEYRTALITNAVTGKIDVRDVILEPEPVEAV